MFVQVKRFFSTPSMHGSAGPVSPAANGRGGIGRAPPSPVVPPYAISSPLSSPTPAGHASASGAAAASPAPAGAAGAPARQDAGSHNVGKFVAPAVEEKIVLGSAAAEEANPRFRPTMEDCHSIHIEKDSAFFGVYDGHGGVLVAQCASLPDAPPPPGPADGALSLRPGCCFAKSRPGLTQKSLWLAQVRAAAPSRESEVAAVDIISPRAGGVGAHVSCDGRTGEHLFFPESHSFTLAHQVFPCVDSH